MPMMVSPEESSPLLALLRVALQSYAWRELTDLAKAVGCSQDLLYRFRRGEVKTLGTDKALALARELGIPTAGASAPRQIKLIIKRRGGAPLFNDRPKVDIPDELKVNEKEARLILLLRSLDPIMLLQGLIEELEAIAERLHEKHMRTHGLINGAVSMLQTVVSYELLRRRRNPRAKKTK